MRLAASDIDPVNLMEASEVQKLQTASAANEPGSLQQQLLIRLFEPQVYDIKKRLFPSSVKNYMDQIKGAEGLKNTEVSLSRLYPGNIYFTVEKYFDWNQENMRNLPHQNIKKQMEREFGKEVTVKGRYNFLYSSNKGFKDAIENQRREYWLCAWYYFYNRYSNEFKDDAIKRKELLELGEIVLEALDQESYKSIKMEIAGIIDQFENL